VIVLTDNKCEFKRVGDVEAITKTGDYITLQISLDGSPDSEWVICFKQPREHKPNHVASMRVIGDKIQISSHIAQVKETIEWVEKYIQYANEAYKKIIAAQEARIKKQRETEEASKEELRRINESLKGL